MAAATGNHNRCEIVFRKANPQPVYNPNNNIICTLYYKMSFMHLPAHCNCVRIWVPSNKWSTIFKFGLIHLIKLVPVLLSLSSNRVSWARNLVPTLMNDSLPIPDFLPAPELFWAWWSAKMVLSRRFLLSVMIISSDWWRASLFFSMNWVWKI